MLNKDEQEYVKQAITYGMKTAEISYIIMTHRSRSLVDDYVPTKHTLKQVQDEFLNLKIEINKIIAKL